MAGCDQTGKSHGHSKLSCWQTFLSFPPDVFKAFQNLEVDFGNPEKDSLVKYVMDLYCKGRPSMISYLGELRWFSFSKYQTESIRLPPAMKAFEQAIQRAYFTILQWNSSHIASPNLPDPCDFGWKCGDTHKIYQPILTTNLPAPESIIDSAQISAKLDAIVVDVLQEPLGLFRDVFVSKLSKFCRKIRNASSR